MVVFGAPTTLWSDKKIKQEIKEKQELDYTETTSYWVDKIFCCRCREERNPAEIDLGKYQMHEVLVRRYNMRWLENRDELMKLVTNLTDENFS